MNTLVPGNKLINPTMQPPPSIQTTLEHINKTLRSTTEGPYSKYSCKTVSWDDVERGTSGEGGGLSCWGANITDTRLYAKDGRALFTVREDNWNERLGKVTSDDIALVASKEDGGGGCSNIRPVTLRTVLSDPSLFGRYAGLTVDDDNLADDILDKAVSVRFQTTFLPVEAGDKSRIEFCPEAYNYNTTNDNDPRNLIFLCTTQGFAIQQDGKGSKKLYHHAKAGNEVHRYWLEAESSSHKVGGSQIETKEEKDDALKRGKATSSTIGVKAIGTRFNVLMTIQVPLAQKQVKPQSNIAQKQMKTQSNILNNAVLNLCLCCCCTTAAGLSLASLGSSHDDKGINIHDGDIPVAELIDRDSDEEIIMAETITYQTALPCKGEVSKPSFTQMPYEEEEVTRSGSAFSPSFEPMDETPQFMSVPLSSTTSKPKQSCDIAKLGLSEIARISSAARVSRGSLVDKWDGLSVPKAKRHPNEHITVTIVLYYTCSGGIPDEHEIKEAIDDLEFLYQSLENGYLQESKFDFMKSDLTKIDSGFPPKPEAPKDFDVFPKS